MPIHRSIVISLRRKMVDEVVQRLPFDLHQRMSFATLYFWIGDNISPVFRPRTGVPKI